MCFLIKLGRHVHHGKSYCFWRSVQGWRLWWVSLTNVGCAGMLRFALLYFCMMHYYTCVLFPPAKGWRGTVPITQCFMSSAVSIAIYRNRFVWLLYVFVFVCLVVTFWYLHFNFLVLTLYYQSNIISWITMDSIKSLIAWDTLLISNSCLI